ncbi:MAG: S41 family peptidase [Muribaculaceae bacterium]|jgi:hypothetical protein|nr:S41 family peptidase [Muribaculaceae bacterium]
MRSLLATLLLLAAAMLPLHSCHDGGIIDEPDSPEGNFRTLCRIIDERYCFLDRHGVDWDSVCRANEPFVGPSISSYNLFLIMSRMLDNLRDGHVNLSSPYGASYYRDWWAAYPADFDERVVTLGYLRGDYAQMGAYTYAIIPGTQIAYLRVESFEHAPGEGNIDFILSRFALAPALIIDIRSNGGGALTAAETLAERFITEPMTGGYVCHKTGPGHNDFSSPRAITFDPPAGHQLWTKPVMLLTNRGTFSAANYFAAFMRTLPQVTQIGATTGGGGGIPFSSSLPNGWTIRFSACPMLDPDGQLTEDGVSPLPAHTISFGPEESARGADPILDHAIDLILSGNQ